VAALTVADFFVATHYWIRRIKRKEGPKSMRNPVFFDEDIQVTVVPVLMQKREFPFAAGILGVAEEEYAVRFTSTQRRKRSRRSCWRCTDWVDWAPNRHTYCALLFLLRTRTRWQQAGDQQKRSASQCIAESS
jgi:hypothetical protein